MSYQLLKNRLGVDDNEKPMANNMAGPGMAAPPSAAAQFGPQAPAAGKQVAQSGAGWVNLQRYMGLAGDQGRQMAQGLVSGVEGPGKELDATAGQMKFGTTQAAGEQLGQAAKVSQNAKQLVDFSGRRDLLQQQAGSNAGESRYDSFLAGAMGGPMLQRAADQFGGLSERLGQASSAAGENFREAEAFRLDAEEKERQRLLAIASLRSEPGPAAHGTGATTRKIRKQVF